MQLILDYPSPEYEEGAVKGVLGGTEGLSGEAWPRWWPGWGRCP